ncbi:hypothetical protein AQ927_09245 [Burkholderia pseudomallei]|nr:hypothetical protein AQ927_09245 [Burkholderia pseudomallei]
MVAATGRAGWGNAGARSCASVRDEAAGAVDSRAVASFVPDRGGECRGRAGRCRSIAWRRRARLNRLT